MGLKLKTSALSLSLVPAYRRTARVRAAVAQREEAVREPEADAGALRELQDVPVDQPPAEEEGADAQAAQPSRPRQEQPQDHLPVPHARGLDHGLLRESKKENDPSALACMLHPSLADIGVGRVDH